MPIGEKKRAEQGPEKMFMIKQQHGKVKVLQTPCIHNAAPPPVPFILWLPGTCKWQGPSGHWKSPSTARPPRLDPRWNSTQLFLSVPYLFSMAVLQGPGATCTKQRQTSTCNPCISQPPAFLCRIWHAGPMAAPCLFTALRVKRQLTYPTSDAVTNPRSTCRTPRTCRCDMSARASDRSEEASPVTATTTTECKDQE